MAHTFVWGEGSDDQWSGNDVTKLTAQNSSDHSLRAYLSLLSGIPGESLGLRKDGKPFLMCVPLPHGKYEVEDINKNSVSLLLYFATVFAIIICDFWPFATKLNKGLYLLNIYVKRSPPWIVNENRC